MPLPSINKNTLDVSQIFQTYITFGGDVDKTAVALDIDPRTIRDLERAENWPAKVEEWNKLREGDPRDVQIQINRAVNYVQAHRLRQILDRVVSHLNEKPVEELVDLLTKTTKAGSEFTARPLTDLTKAIESCQLMTQRALGDTVAERPEESPDKGGSRVALQVMAAMNAADSLGLDSVAVVRKELAAPAKPVQT